MAFNDFVTELRWRGMLQDMMPGTEEQLAKEMTSAYIGFDPTATSLHIGNLATIMLLVHLQRSGHKPFALVGGATGMIGDPSFKNAERKLLDEETLQKNQAGIKAQLERFLDFDSGANSAEIVNNYDWFKDFNFLDFLRIVGKHITVNYMMSKESVKQRLDTGLSYTEFAYQLIQGYDFYWLNQNKGIKLQMGGSDQWGNITTGTELIRRMSQGEAYALTTPLITKSDGSKFGKSEGGNIWLDPEMTSPYQFYQFWLNCADEDSSKLIRVFTLLDEPTILQIEADHKEAPHLRLMQKAIAKDVTIRVHCEAEYEMAVKASEILFGKSTAEDLASLNEKTLLQVFEGVPQTTISQDAFAGAASYVDLLSEVTDNLVFPSKGEARKMIKGGGVSVNREKIEDGEQKPEITLLRGKYFLAQKGKKNYYLIKVD
jgi:tyrosyl-tRNA synthetase